MLNMHEAQNALAVIFTFGQNKLSAFFFFHLFTFVRSIWLEYTIGMFTNAEAAGTSTDS